MASQSAFLFWAAQHSRNGLAKKVKVHHEQTSHLCSFNATFQILVSQPYVIHGENTQYFVEYNESQNKMSRILKCRSFLDMKKHYLEFNWVKIEWDILAKNAS